MAGYATAKEVQNYYKFNEYPEYLTLRSKNDFSATTLDNIVKGQEKIDHQKAIDLFHEMISMEALAVARGGLDKVKDIKDRNALYSACAAEIKGFEAEGGIIGLNGVMRFGPTVDGKALYHTVAGESQLKSLKNFADRGYTGADKAAKILGKDIVLASDVRSFYTDIANQQKCRDLVYAITPYVDTNYLTKVQEEIPVDSKAALDKLFEEAKKHFGQVDLNAKVLYRAKDGSERERNGVKCTEGKINLQQKNELMNYEIGKYREKLIDEALKANNDRPLSKDQLIDINFDSNNLPQEILDRVNNMSYTEAKEAMGKLPVSMKQKFILGKVLNVNEDKFKNLNRNDASVLIKKVSNEIKSAEVSKDIREYAERFNLVQPGKGYTYENWNKDSMNVPPMPAIKQLAERLNLYDNLDWRKKNVCAKAQPARELGHADYIAVITAYYERADERINGPVLSYQQNAVPEAALCGNWQEAEKMYLDRCVMNRMIGEDEARYLLNCNRELINCPSERLLDFSLSDEERNAAAAQVKSVVQSDMIKNRIRYVSFAYKELIGEQDLTDANKCICHAINQIVGKVSTAQDYVTRTSDNVADIVRVALKNGYHAPAGSPAGTDIKNLAAAVMSNTPGLVGKPGTNRERYQKVVNEVKAVKHSLENANTGKTKVERRRANTNYNGRD